MDSDKNKNCLLIFNETTIKCCKCYEEYWRKKRDSSSSDKERVNVFTFDYSIEKVKSFRKYFEEDRILFHFCINCLQYIMLSIPLPILEFEAKERIRGGCIVKFLAGSITVNEVCNGCFTFAIHQFSNDSCISI